MRMNDLGLTAQHYNLAKPVREGYELRPPPLWALCLLAFINGLMWTYIAFVATGIAS